MPMFVAVLYRAVPLVVGLVVLGIIIYVVLYNSRGAQGAKSAFARIFWWICLVGTVIFGIIALYAFGENNTNLAEFFLVCAGTMVCFWVLTRFSATSCASANTTAALPACRKRAPKTISHTASSVASVIAARSMMNGCTPYSALPACYNGLSI